MIDKKRLKIILIFINKIKYFILDIKNAFFGKLYRNRRRNK